MTASLPSPCFTGVSWGLGRLHGPFIQEEWPGISWSFGSQRYPVYIVEETLHRVTGIQVGKKASSQVLPEAHEFVHAKNKNITCSQVGTTVFLGTNDLFTKKKSLHNFLQSQPKLYVKIAIHSVFT